VAIVGANQAKHSEIELKALKESVGLMWRLTLSQIQKCKQAYLTDDEELAREIVSREKRVRCKSAETQQE
jgi:phosphate transport system protein